MKFITALNCMDGRTIEPILNYFKTKLNIDNLYVDMITEPGIDKFLTNIENIEKLETKIRISLVNHDSNYVIIAGHYDCAGNPVDYEQHRNDIINSVYNLYNFLISKNFFNKNDKRITLIGIYVNEKWNIEEIINLDIS
ncbi:MAG: hypothetical protein N2485_05525 [bacterium]|nr:hypothetical protein [bacterium]